MSLQPDTPAVRVSCGFANLVFLVLYLFSQILNVNLYTLQIQNQFNT